MRRITMSVCLLLILLGGASAGLAPAASAAKISPNVSDAVAVVVEDTVTITYTTNRSAKESLRLLSCTLDGTPVECGEVSPTGTTKKSTNFTVTYSGLAAGEHTWEVAFLQKGVGSVSFVRFEVV